MNGNTQCVTRVYKRIATETAERKEYIYTLKRN